MMATPCNRYMEMQVQTAPAENLVLMLYDGALRFARQAQVSLAEGRMQDAHNDLTRAQDILGELMGSLNMGDGEFWRLHEEAAKYGVDTYAIKPYPCGPERDQHDHLSEPHFRYGMESRTVTRVQGKESECEECTESVEETG